MQVLSSALLQKSHSRISEENRGGKSADSLEMARCWGKPIDAENFSVAGR